MEQHDVSYTAIASGEDAAIWYVGDDMTLASYEKPITINAYLDSENRIEQRVDIHCMTWDLNIPKDIALVPGFDKSGVVHLCESYSSLPEVEPWGVSHLYFAYGKTLEKIRVDYERFSGMFWRMAQMIVPDFPHHSVGSNITIVDPLDDLPSDDFDTGLYAKVIKNDVETLPIRVELALPTTGRKLHPRCELHYNASGRLGGFSSHTKNGDKVWCLKISFFGGQWYVAEISAAIKTYIGTYREQVLYSGDYHRYMSVLRDRGIVPGSMTYQSSRRSRNNSSRTNTSRYMWSESISSPHFDWLDRDERTLHKAPHNSQGISGNGISGNKVTDEELSRITVDCEVSHDAFGKGVITSIDESYVMVKFSDRERRFQWPDAFKKGFLSLE